MARQRIRYQHELIKVNAPGVIMLIEFVTDQLYKRVTGVNLVYNGAISSKFSKMYMEIDSEEIFPKEWEILRILLREQGPNGEDYYPLNVRAEGSHVKVEYRDYLLDPMPNPPPYPYWVVISLRLENDKPQEATIIPMPQTK